jgi:hypothetical protein
MSPMTHNEREGRFVAMRARLRQAGFEVKAVSWVRRQDDGEFAELPKWAWTSELENTFLELLTKPGTPFFISRENDRAYWLAVAL